MKIAKLLMLLLLSSSLMYCTKSTVPDGGGNNGGGGNDVPGGDIPDDPSFDGLKPEDPSFLGDDYTTGVRDSGSHYISNPKTLQWSAGKDTYYKGFTAKASDASEYYNKASGITWNHPNAGDGKPYLQIIYFVNGKKQAVNMGGETTKLDTETKNAILCSNNKQLRVFILLDKSLRGGHQDGQKAHIDSYIEAPPLTLIGDRPANCS